MNQSTNSSSKQSACFYKNTRDYEIKDITTKIRHGDELIHKIQNTIHTSNVQERTLKEFNGMMLVKKAEIECNKNLIKLIEEIPDCI